MERSVVSSEFNRILVPLDGSTISEQVLTPVISLARSTASSVVLVRIVPTGGSIRRMAAHPLRRSSTQDKIRIAELEEISDYLSVQAEELRSQGIEVAIDVAHGAPEEEIVVLGSRHRASLIAMCTHGRIGLRRLALGSVAEQVLRRSALPLLLYRPTEDAPQRGDAGQVGFAWSKLAVPLDGSLLSEMALELAGRLALASDLQVELVHVLADTSRGPHSATGTDDAAGVAEDRQTMETYLSDRAGALSQQGIQASYRILNGDPSVRMVEAAQEDSDTLLVMSTHGRTGVGRMMHGSVADHLVRNSSTPVLLVRGRPSTIGGGRYRLL